MSLKEHDTANLKMSKQTFLLIFLFTVFHIALIKGQSDEPLNSILTRASTYQDNKNYAAAEAVLDSLLAIYPENAELYFRLAHAKTLSAPNLLEIMNLLESCLFRDSLHYQALYLKSQYFTFIGHFQGVLQIEDKLIEVYPELLLLKIDRVSTYLFNGYFDTVLDEVKTLLPRCTCIEEAERLLRSAVYANYFQEDIASARTVISEMADLGLNVDFFIKLIEEHSLTFEEFATGKNVGISPCPLSELQQMFPLRRE